MFNNGMSQRMDLLKDFVPTSKVQLKGFCMRYANGDVKKATELYNFYADGIELPDKDPIQPSRMESVKEGVTDVIGFVRENGDDIINAVSFVKELFGKKAAASAVADALPNIN